MKLKKKMEKTLRKLRRAEALGTRPAACALTAVVLLAVCVAAIVTFGAAVGRLAGLLSILMPAYYSVAISTISAAFGGLAVGVCGAVYWRRTLPFLGIPKEAKEIDAAIGESAVFGDSGGDEDWKKPKLTHVSKTSFGKYFQFFSPFAPHEIWAKNSHIFQSLDLQIMELFEPDGDGRIICMFVRPGAPDAKTSGEATPNDPIFSGEG